MKFNKPKIAIWNAKEQTANLIEVTAPQNYNVVSAIDNKMTKYKDLQIEIKKLEPENIFYRAGCDW